MRVSPLSPSISAASTALAALLFLAPVRADASPLERVVALTPADTAQLSPQAADQLVAAARELDDWAGEQYSQPIADPQQVLKTVERLLDAKSQVDKQLDSVLAMRGAFVGMPEGAKRREALRQYLRVTSQLIDLSGRLRYTLRDAIDTATYDLTSHPRELDALIDMLIEKRVSIGAAVMTFVLFDPPPESGVAPFPLETKKKVLQLISVTRQGDLLPQLAEFIQQEGVVPELIVTAAYVIRQIGLPQDAANGQGATLPPPPITARQLSDIVSRTDPARLDPQLAKSRAETLAWLEQRIRHGETGDVFRCRGLDLRAGDWLLMRNPSPYNLFTDLAPGLFTHVGIVTAIKGDDGIRRFVIVDMPERGARVPAGNVDAYLEQTLHFFFLRHTDPKVQQEMGAVAAQLIGCETQFDLEFDTARVLAEKGKPLAGRRVHTYCAGFLLLNAQETSAPREDFFPIFENPAGGHCLENLSKLGLSIGEDFVSPTTALFSSKLEIVGRREPMYSPGREVKESVYDHFAKCMIEDELRPSPDLFQSLRTTVAAAAKTNPWLAQLLAKTNNVSAYMDLESAAKAAAVIETLDKIAADTSDDYHEANFALLSGPLEQLRAEGLSEERLAKIGELRTRHADLIGQAQRGEIGPRELRIALVEYYQRVGRQRLDERFFAAK